MLVCFSRALGLKACTQTLEAVKTIKVVKRKLAAAGRREGRQPQPRQRMQSHKHDALHRIICTARILLGRYASTHISIRV